MPNEGWVKLWRKSLDGDMLKNHSLWIFWTWCLLKASHKRHKQLIGYQEIWLEPGQFIFGRSKAAEETGLSEQTIRTCIKSLKSTSNVTIKVTSKFTVITIVNWTYYQSNEDESTSKVTSKSTNGQPASNQQLTTNKNVKNVKNVKTTTLKKTLSLEDSKRLNVFWEKCKREKKLIPENRITVIFDHWNAQSIIVHKKLTERIKQKLRTHLKDNTIEDVNQAIDNYSIVFKNPGDYFFKYRWTLIDFLDRGLRKFLNEAQPLTNYQTPEAKERQQAADRVQPPRPEFPKKLTCKFCNQVSAVLNPAYQCPRCNEPFYKLLESNGTRTLNIPTKADLVTCSKCSYSWSYKACYTRTCPNCGRNNRKKGRTDANIQKKVDKKVQYKKDGIFAYDSTYSDQLTVEAKAEAKELEVAATGLLKSVPALTQEEREGLHD